MESKENSKSCISCKHCKNINSTYYCINPYNAPDCYIIENPFITNCMRHDPKEREETKQMNDVKKEYTYDREEYVRSAFAKYIRDAGEYLIKNANNIVRQDGIDEIYISLTISRREGCDGIHIDTTVRPKEKL